MSFRTVRGPPRSDGVRCRQQRALPEHALRQRRRVPRLLHRQDDHLLRQHRSRNDAQSVHQVPSILPSGSRRPTQPAHERAQCGLPVTVFSFLFHRGRFFWPRFSRRRSVSYALLSVAGEHENNLAHHRARFACVCRPDDRRVLPRRIHREEQPVLTCPLHPTDDADTARPADANEPVCGPVESPWVSHRPRSTRRRT